MVDEDVFYGEGRDFGEENPAKSVGNRGVDTSEREFSVIGGVLVKANVEVLGP